MTGLILIRHGQSLWNAENRFTGWVDSPLSEKGKEEALKAGKLIKKANIDCEICFTSCLSRAINTLEIMISELNKNNLKIIKAWQLNERHYGSLTGLNKIDTRKKLGEGLFLKYRRSWDIAPPAIETKNIKKYNFTKSIIGLPKEKIPKTESLKDTYKRVIEFYKKSIVEFVFNKKTVVIAAHGNSLRALCKYLFNISDHDINYLEIPTGNPMVINFEENFNIKSAYYLDKSRAEKIVNIN